MVWISAEDMDFTRLKADHPMVVARRETAAPYNQVEFFKDQYAAQKPVFDLDAYEREIAEVQALVSRGGAPLREEPPAPHDDEY